MYDLIGDIHGYATPLKSLLSQMGYAYKEGFWQHPNRKAIFVGDFIDRGPEIREVLHIVKKMVDNGHALAVMGNHEYNAIAYAHKTSETNYLRSHNSVHTKQHQLTIDQFANYSAEWDEWIEWFYSLPLFLDLGELRIVHACWNHKHIKWLKENYDGKLSTELLIKAHEKGSYANTVIEETLKGKEINIPEHCAWSDNDGHLRITNRVKWWVGNEHATHEAFLFNCPDILKDQPLPKNLKLEYYPEKDPPVFFGHYWLEDKWPVIQSGNVVCLDYSIAKGGNLVAYRWSGEQTLHPQNFVVIPS
jgi:hypothetical protein